MLQFSQIWVNFLSLMQAIRRFDTCWRTLNQWSILSWRAFTLSFSKVDMLSPIACNHARASVRTAAASWCELIWINSTDLSFGITKISVETYKRKKSMMPHLLISLPPACKESSDSPKQEEEEEYLPNMMDDDSHECETNDAWWFTWMMHGFSIFKSHFEVLFKLLLKKGGSGILGNKFRQNCHPILLPKLLVLAPVF